MSRRINGNMAWGKSNVTGQCKLGLFVRAAAMVNPDHTHHRRKASGVVKYVPFPRGSLQPALDTSLFYTDGFWGGLFYQHNLML